MDAHPSTALDAVPQDWLAALPGQCLASVNAWVLPDDPQETTTAVQQLLVEDTLVAVSLADAMATAYTDFALHADGFSRLILIDQGLSPRRLGRLLQSLLEIETYRMAALLGLPAARETAAVLASAERELAELADAIRSAQRADEPILLDRLTRLAGQVESQHAATHSRFSASAAYFALVDERIAELAETRLPGRKPLANSWTVG